MKVGIRKVTADLRELTSVKESIFLGEKERRGDEILDSCNDRFAVSRRDKVMLDAHEFESLCSRFFRLGYI